MSWSRAADLAAHAGSHGVEMISRERARQIGVEGWTPEHDDEHDKGELAAAAVGYIGHAIYRRDVRETPSPWWPHDWEWKPSDDPVRNLVKAGALIAAEIDRIERSRSADR